MGFSIAHKYWTRTEVTVKDKRIHRFMAQAKDQVDLSLMAQ
jgi:hypothetical protein